MVCIQMHIFQVHLFFSLLPICRCTYLPELISNVNLKVFLFMSWWTHKADEKAEPRPFPASNNLLTKEGYSLRNNVYPLQGWSGTIICLGASISSELTITSPSTYRNTCLAAILVKGVYCASFNNSNDRFHHGNESFTSTLPHYGWFPSNTPLQFSTSTTPFEKR